MRNMTKGENIA